MNILTVDVFIGNATEMLQKFDDNVFQCCVTSPPYYRQRNYHVETQIGQEKTPNQYIEHLLEVFGEIRRTLKNDGVLWVNIGDCFVNKELLGIPWMFVYGMKNDGWHLRSEIIWNKTNAKPDPARDRPGRSHEQIFLFSKSNKYYYDADAVKEPYTTPLNRWGGEKLIDKGNGKWAKATGEKIYRDRKQRPDPNGRHRRSVWSFPTGSYKGAHFAVFPTTLPEICIKAGSKPGDTILDPFAGSGTTGQVAKQLGRNAVLIELNPEYLKLIEKRMYKVANL